MDRTPEASNARPGARQWLFALYAWLLLGLLALPVWLGVVLAPRAAWRWAIARGAARLLLRLLGVPVALHGDEHVHGCLPCVLIANHASYTDPLILAAVLPLRFAFTPSRAFERNPLVRVFMARLGSHFVGGGDQRGDAARLAGLVRAGQSLVVFPEGVVHATPGIRPFHSGAFVAAVEADAPVLPIVIHGSRRLFRHRHYVPRWSPLEVVVLPPVAAAGGVERLRAAARDAILAEAGERAVEPPI